MGSGVTPSDFFTHLPFDFVPCGDDRLGIGDCGCMNVCVLQNRSEGRSVSSSLFELELTAVDSLPTP